MRDIHGFTTDDCELFYRTYYAPNNATIVLVGDFDPTEALSLISAQYGSIESAQLPKRNYPQEPVQQAERLVQISKPTVSEKLSIGYHSVALGDPEHVVVGLLCEVLAGGRASRLYRSLVRDQKLAAEVRAYVGPFGDPGLLELYAAARGEHTAAELLAAMDEELRSICKEPVDRAELERAAARMELGLLHGLESAEGKAHTIGFYDCVLDQPDAPFRRLDAMRSVTPKQLQQVARRALDPKIRSVIVVHPDSHVQSETHSTEGEA
jgi:zinc protease